jgi:hypothetical protein
MGQYPIVIPGDPDFEQWSVRLNHRDPPPALDAVAAEERTILVDEQEGRREAAALPSYGVLWATWQFSMVHNSIRLARDCGLRAPDFRAMFVDDQPR